MHQLEDLRTFVAVVEAGSFTAAADRLGIAKSAASRRVASLEGGLGVQLLQRTTRRLNLTDTGLSFYERCARILADLDEAEAAVHHTAVIRHSPYVQTDSRIRANVSASDFRPRSQRQAR